MVQGKKRKKLTLEEIYKYISPYDIYRRLAGEFRLNVPFNSPIPGRKDRNPSFVIGVKDEKLSHIDFGSPAIRGDAIDFVMQMTGAMTYNDALMWIDKEFCLGISTGEAPAYQSIIGKYQAPKIITKPPCLIQVSVRKFNKEELAYWSQYLLDISDLQYGEIYAPKDIFLNRRKIPLKKTELKFAYRLGDKWKIYTPYTEEKKLKWWPNNIHNSSMEGLDSLKGAEKGIITKSRKDRLVIRKLFPYVSSVQNESLIAFSAENIGFLEENVGEKYISYDIDGPGKEASHLVTRTLGYKHINVPDKYLPEGIKDWADLAKAYGLKPIENHLKLKGLL